MPVTHMENPSAVLYAPGVVKIEDRPIPTIEDPHDVLIRIAFVGVCGSDVHFWKHGGINGKVPPASGLIMGHEASGIVHEIGAEVASVKIGDRVAIEPGVPCRRCEACKHGTYNLCKSLQFAAAPGQLPGTLAKFFRVPEDFVHRVPEVLSLEEAVFAEPMSVAVHAVKMVDIRPGETVVVMGSGTIGLLSAAVARHFGAHRMVLVDILDAKLEFARQYLACETFKPDMVSAETNAERLLQHLGNASVDTVIEASGAAPSIETGIYILRPGGKYVQTGLGRPKIEFPIVTLSEKELLVRGCFRYGPGDYELATSLLTKGVIDVKPLLSSISSFEDTAKAWDRTMRGEGIKNLIRVLHT